MNKLDAYKKLNNSFKKELIFHLGAEMGFYSEFNNMVFAMLYCLKNGYKFVLYSDDANFKINKGWDDFFKPFCKETRFFLHNRVNNRHIAPALSKKTHFFFKIYRKLFKNTFFTYELWDNFFNPTFEKEFFDIPELGIKGNLREASRVIVKMIYRFNEETKLQVANLTNGLNLPDNYLAVNIRRGDKDTEFKFISINKYIDKLEGFSNNKNLFVFTDDYRVVEDLMAFKDFTIFSLVDKSEHGYVHGKFLKLSKQEKRYYLLKMFAAIEIVCNADYAVGTFTTNPGVFFGIRMADEKFFSVQRSSWYQFEMDDIKDFVVHDFLKNQPSKT